MPGFLLSVAVILVLMLVTIATLTFIPGMLIVALRVLGVPIPLNLTSWLVTMFILLVIYGALTRYSR